MLVLGYPAAEAGPLDHEVTFGQCIDSALHRGLIKLEHRVAIALLVASVDQGIEGQRILIGRRAVLLDEAADHARIERSQFDIHAGNDSRRDFLPLTSCEKFVAAAHADIRVIGEKTVHSGVQVGAQLAVETAEGGWRGPRPEFLRQK